VLPCLSRVSCEYSSLTVFALVVAGAVRVFWVDLEYVEHLRIATCCGVYEVTEQFLIAHVLCLKYNVNHS
jgi:hypothetical protein